MKKLKYILLMLIILPCFLLSGCSIPTAKTVTDISVGNQSGSTTTYTITYSDGTTSQFSVQDGENGKDGENLTLDSIKAYCTKNNINYETFLKEYFNLNLNPIKTATNSAINSAVAIFTVNPCEYHAAANAVTISGGAGVIYSMDKSENGYSHIVTNQHVVASSLTQGAAIAKKIVLLQYGCRPTFEKLENYSTGVHSCYKSDYKFIETSIEAKYIGGSAAYDIAVLRVKTSDLLKVNEHACEVSTASGYELGETTIAIGNPEGDGISVTQGIVSVVSENIQYSDSSYTYRVLRTDAAVNGGNSGGGLFNINSELIGIVNAKIEDTKVDNIAYAIPIDLVKLVADNIIKDYSSEPVTAKKLYFNITTIVDNSHMEYNKEYDTLTIKDNPKIYSVNDNGIGKEIGLQVGDIITKLEINSHLYTINRSYEFGELLLNVRAGDTVKILGTRAGVENVTLGTINEVQEAQLVNPDSLI